MKEDEKKRLQATAEGLNAKSVSEFVRKILDEKMAIEEFAQTTSQPENLVIPSYVPEGKYVAFVNGAVVGVGDNPSDVAQIAVGKFPNLPLVIKFNGPRQKPMEYVYISLSNPQSWKYIQYEDASYPIVPISLQSEAGKTNLVASVDTAASICVLRADQMQDQQFAISRTEEISTAGGIIEADILLGHVCILDATFDAEFIRAPISSMLPFKFLIGRNLLDQLDAYFFGKKQILMLKWAE